MTKSNSLYLSLIVSITILGGLLRFINLGTPPLWIDEVLFVWFSHEPIPSQELVPAFIMKVLPENEFWIRFPFALAGTLTIPVIYWNAKDKRLGLALAALTAFFPLTVFWSRMARPYVFAGLFVALGWRFWWCHFIAILTTPSALMGINLAEWKKLLPEYALLLLLAVVVYSIRGDVQSGKDFINLDFLLSVRRLLYVPFITICLYLGKYVVPHMVNRHTNIKKRTSTKLVRSARVVQ